MQIIIHASGQKKQMALSDLLPFISKEEKRAIESIPAELPDAKNKLTSFDLSRHVTLKKGNQEISAIVERA